MSPGFVNLHFEKARSSGHPEFADAVDTDSPPYRDEPFPASPGLTALSRSFWKRQLLTMGEEVVGGMFWGGGGLVR